MIARRGSGRFEAFLLCLIFLNFQLTGLPASRFEPFVDVTDQLGLTGLANNAAAWGDFDNDGWVDLYVNGQLWRNVRGRKFELVDTPDLKGNGGIWADFDNDGFLDLFCWGNRKLFLNLGGTAFKDVTDRLPALPVQLSRGAVWGDFDSNGFVDLYIGGYEVWREQKEYPDVIVENRDGMRFLLSWEQSAPILRARGVTAADFDNDGDLDLYVSNYRLQPNLLWVNQGDGKFVEQASKHNLRHTGDPYFGHTIGSSWGDFDSDGLFDLLVGNFSHPSSLQDRPLFFRNLGPEGDYRFEGMSRRVGLQWQESYASTALADFDNDGFLDFYLTTVYEEDRSVLYRNNGDWTFTDVTDQTSVETRLTYQAAWADYDNDGQMDLLSGGRLFRNPGQGGKWFKVRLVGRGRSNYSAVGARVSVYLGQKVLVRQVEAGTGEGNQNEMTLHFGLGEWTGSFDVRIRWPDGSLQELHGEPNSLVIVQQRK